MMNLIDDIRTRITLKEHGLSNVHTSDYPRTYPGYNDAFNINTFKKKFQIHVTSLNKEVMEFDMIKIDAAIANAYRRILLSEIPTMAIEKVFMFNNTSVIQDEVLAHRLGLIPLDVDARLFEFRQPSNEDGTPEDTLEMELKVKCTKNLNASKETSDPNELYNNHKVYSGDFKWIPRGNQSETMTLKLVHDDILIAKLRPGHEIDLKVHAVKGLGKDHAKFSSVATASYRLLPEIKILRPIVGEEAEEFKNCFSPGVITIVKNKAGLKEAKVVNARKDTCSREVLRHPHLKDSVKLSKVRDHFIFSVESAIGHPPNILVTESIKILIGKCRFFLQELNSSQQNVQNNGSKSDIL